jgi:hypothetical protein
MTRKKGDISQFTYSCYVVKLAPGQKTKKVIEYQHFKQLAAAKFWVNQPTRLKHERYVKKAQLSAISGCFDYVATFNLCVKEKLV